MQSHKSDYGFRAGAVKNTTRYNRTGAGDFLQKFGFGLRGLFNYGFLIGF